MDVSQKGWGIGFSIVHARFQQRVSDVENHTTKGRVETLARWMLYQAHFHLCPFLINL